MRRDVQNLSMNLHPLSGSGFRLKDIMWKLVTSTSPTTDPNIRSHNNFIGRQIWEYDAEAGSPQQRQNVENARKAFVRGREGPGGKNHSGDELLRLQALKKLEAAKISVPSGILYRKEPVPKERLEGNLRAAVKFYEALQQESGFWAGDYGGPLFLFPALVVGAYVTGQV